MAHREWKMENGKWRIADGEWQMENGKMENGTKRMAHRE